MSLAVSDSSLRLTPRQWQVARLRLQGLGRRQIAHRLGISYHTVRRDMDAARRNNGFTDELDLLIALDRRLR